MCFRRQIAFLKEAMIKLEERTKQEIESLETDCIAKFEKLKNEKVQIENFYKEEIHKLKVFIIYLVLCVCTHDTCKSNYIINNVDTY